MNLATGHLESVNGNVEAVFANNRITVDPVALDRHKRVPEFMNKEIVIGIRPGAYQEVSHAAFDTTGRTMEVDARVVEVLGSETLVHFDIGAPPVVTPDIEELLADTGQTPESLGKVSSFTARVNPDVHPRPGDRVKLAIDTKKLHFFDPATGERIR